MTLPKAEREKKSKALVRECVDCGSQIHFPRPNRIRCRKCQNAHAVFLAKLRDIGNLLELK